MHFFHLYDRDICTNITVTVSWCYMIIDLLPFLISDPPPPLPCSGCVGQVIVMVGLPARGKTYIAKKLTRKEDNSLHISTVPTNRDPWSRPHLGRLRLRHSFPWSPSQSDGACSSKILRLLNPAWKNVFFMIIMIWFMIMIFLSRELWMLLLQLGTWQL